MQFRIQRMSWDDLLSVQVSALECSRTMPSVISFFSVQKCIHCSVLPLRIQQSSASELSIMWDDQHAGRTTLRKLRTACPCASCKIKRDERGGKVLLPILKPGEFQVTTMVPVGQYAIRVAWGDGHSTGIYTFELLRSLCECEECTVSIPSIVRS